MSNLVFRDPSTIVVSGSRGFPHLVCATRDNEIIYYYCSHRLDAQYRQLVIRLFSTLIDLCRKIYVVCPFFVIRRADQSVMPYLNSQQPRQLMQKALEQQ